MEEAPVDDMMLPSEQFGQVGSAVSTEAGARKRAIGVARLRSIEKSENRETVQQDSGGLFFQPESVGDFGPGQGATAVQQGEQVELDPCEDQRRSDVPEGEEAE